MARELLCSFYDIALLTAKLSEGPYPDAKTEKCCFFKFNVFSDDFNVRKFNRNNHY